MTTDNDKQRKQVGDRRIGQGCLTVFGLPFAIAGLYLLYLSLAQMWLAWEAGSWQPVNATIEQVKLVTHRSSDSDTYEVEAHYHFDYGGQRYNSTAVTVDGLADSNRERHQKIYNRLIRYQGRNNGYMARMDPDDPRRSLLITELDWTKVALLGGMGLLFGGVGFGLIIGGAVGARTLRQEQQREQRHPDQPWRWKTQWQDGVIRSDDRERLLGIGIFALIWNAVSAPLPFVFLSEWQSGNKAILIAGIFPVIGLILAGVWGKRWWHRRQFGEMVLQLDPWPGRIGGQLLGSVAIQRQLPPGTTVRVTLSSVRRRERGSGKSRRMVEEVLWEQVQVAQVSQVGLQRSSVPVRFNIPAGLQQSDWSDSANQIAWRLEMKATLDGIDLDAHFEVPVFNGEGGLPSLQQLLQAEEVDAATSEPDLDQQLTRSGISRFPVDGGGIEFLFPARRHPIVALFLVLISVGLAGATIVFNQQMPTFVQVLLWLFALPMAWMALLIYFESYRLRVKPGQMWVERRFLGRRRVTSLGVRDLKVIDVRVGMQINARSFYRLLAQQSSGRELVAGNGIEGLYLAKRIAALVEEILRR